MTTMELSHADRANQYHDALHQERRTGKPAPFDVHLPEAIADHRRQTLDILQNAPEHAAMAGYPTDAVGYDSAAMLFLKDALVGTSENRHIGELTDKYQKPRIGMPLSDSESTPEMTTIQYSPEAKEALMNVMQHKGWRATVAVAIASELYLQSSLRRDAQWTGVYAASVERQ